MRQMFRMGYAGQVMKLQSIDLNLLLLFEAVHRHRNVTQAAHGLALTQSAASNALARLRRAFDDPLFVKTSRGMFPTARADELIDAVRQALGLLEAALSGPAGFDPRTSTRTFCLRLTDMGETMFLPPLIQRLKSLAPGVGVKAVHVPLGQMHDQLESGEIDVAIGFIPGLQAGIRQRRLFHDQYVCAMRADHPDIGESLSPRQFEQLEHVRIVSPGSGHEVVQRAYEKSRLVQRISVTVNHFVSVPNIIASTDLVVTIPSRLGRALAQTKLIKLLPPPVPLPSIEIKQHWHERFHKDGGNKWLRVLLSDTFAQ